jgi:hypothetical protein
VAINRRGQVLIEPEFLPGVSSIWENGTVRRLPALSGSLGTMIARDINNRSEVVGLSSMPDGSSAATLWHQDVAINLRTRIATNDPLRPFVRLVNARLNNDVGQIVALGADSRNPNGDFQYYLLDPLQEGRGSDGLQRRRSYSGASPRMMLMSRL